MLRAIVRAVSPAMNRCELTYLDRQEIDINVAKRQHAEYVQRLRDAGLTVFELPADPRLPDSAFVEDPAVVVDEVAVIARMGAESRRGEAHAMADALGRFRTLVRMTAPGTLDGGDVFRVGQTLFAGLSQRTNSAGIGQLRDAVTPWGYDVRTVEVRGCLHLKSAVCWVGADTMLVNRECVDATAFDGYDLV